MTNNLSSQSVYFCRRNGRNDYTEVGSLNFMAELKKSNVEQILIYIHGFSNLPEPDIFPRAAALQGLFDKKQEGLVLVVPLIWPCDDDPGIIKHYPKKIWTKFESEQFKHRFGDNSVIPIWFSDVDYGAFDITKKVGGMAWNVRGNTEEQIIEIGNTLIKMLSDRRIEESQGK